MRSHKLRTSTKRMSIVAAMSILLFLALGAATLAQADGSRTAFSRVEADLIRQSQTLSGRSEAWASEVAGRIQFALGKLRLADAVLSPATANTHLEHACRAIGDARALLIQAQSADTSDSALIEQLIDETFIHREALGCRD